MRAPTLVAVEAVQVVPLNGLTFCVWGLQVPLMTIEGNHEIENDAANHTFLSYTDRYRMPAPESNSTSQLYYSFDTGGKAILCCLCRADVQGCCASAMMQS